MDVVRDLLDNAVFDRNRREMGRVDGIELDVGEGEPPRLAAVLIGPSVLGERWGPAVGRWVAALEHAFGVDGGRPVRVDCAEITAIDRDVTVAPAIGQTAAATVEERLRAWVANIPGSE